MRLALGQVLETALGRRLLYAVIEDAGVFRSTFDPSALIMAHAEGERRQGLALLLQLQDHFPEQCDLVLREGLEWRRELARVPEEPAE